MSNEVIDSSRRDREPVTDQIAADAASTECSPDPIALCSAADTELPPPPNPAPKIAAEIAARVLSRVPGSVAAADSITVPGYEIISRLGRGGMGVVYKARQLKLNRIVALKMVLAGAEAHPKEIVRFRTEAEAVARLQHPNIVQIIEAGEHDGRPYFALEFVDSGTLAHKLSGRPQSAATAARIIERLARAVHFAHLHGIVHRDIKPANVLLARTDRSDAIELTNDPSDTAPRGVERFEPKLADFGLAKQLELDSAQTKTGELIGTPSYMAPEQACGSKAEIGPAADIYALGAILYETLTGRPPVLGDTALETIRQVCEEEPVAPSRLQPKVPRDLDTVCLKCLQKNPRRRYSTAAEMADELQRFLASEPIQARPIRQWERIVKWSRRRPAFSALVSVIALAVAAIALGGWWSTAQLSHAAGELRADRTVIRQQRDLAEQQRDEEKRLRAEAENQRLRAEDAYRMARRNLYVAHMNLAQNAWREAHVARAVELLDEYRHTPPEQEELRGFEWQYLWRLCHSDRLTFRGHTDEVDAVVYSPDGRLIASADKNQVVKLWDAALGQQVLTLSQAGTSLAFSPDGKRLVTGGNRLVRIWDTQSGEKVATLNGHKNWVTDVAFSPDGTRIASASSDKSLRIWDATTAEPIATMNEQSSLKNLVFSPDGQFIAVAGSTDVVNVWDVTARAKVRTLPDPEGSRSQFGGIAFSPDGQILAAGGRGTVVLWDIANDWSPRTIAGHRGSIASVAFSSDGRWLATGGFDQILHIWDVGSGQELQSLRGHTGTITGIGFSPDGKHVSTASRDNTVKVWDAAAAPESRVLTGHNTIVETVAFSRDGKLLASGSGDSVVPGKPGELKLWDVNTGRELRHIHAHAERIFGIAFSPNGQWLASASQDKSVKIWNVADELAEQSASAAHAQSAVTLVTFLRPHGLATPAQSDAKLTLTHHTDWVLSIAFSPDGRFLATGSKDRTVRIADATTGQELRTLDGHSAIVTAVSFSPDGRYLASCSGGTSTSTKPGEIILWDVAAGEAIRTMQGHTGPVRDVAFSTDGNRLASTSADKTIRLWDVASGDEVKSFQGHSQGGYCLAYSPDGRRLASGSNDVNAKIWDTATGRELLTLRGHSGGIHSIAFSPDGLHIGTGSYDGTIRIWDANPTP